jgi:lipopolysaccharide/colanic/teichoic acid biosynthesis glycosyltransferase
MYKHVFKRLIDICIGLVALPFVLLIIVALGPIIYFTDKGPVFYNADRIGKYGKHFRMFKLRSMYVNSPDLKNADGSTYNSDNDPRVTPIGRFMRKTSLDEFPQFLNILIGNMSFIGPRPKIGQIDYDNLTDDKRKSYSIKPGVTGYSQAFFRNSITNDEKYYYDAYYADNISFMMDVKIVLQTAKSVLFRENINTDQSYKK